MTAKEIISTEKRNVERHPSSTIEASMPLLEILPRLLESPVREIGVRDGAEELGVIDESSLLEGLGKMIAARDDCSVITLECRAEDYSASLLAHAVEDSDAHLVDLLTTPGNDGNITVTLRVRHNDPSAAVRSLERYDFHVIDAHGAGSRLRDAEISAERLLSLQTLLNV